MNPVLRKVRYLDAKSRYFLDNTHWVLQFRFKKYLYLDIERVIITESGKPLINLSGLLFLTVSNEYRNIYIALIIPIALGIRSIQENSSYFGVVSGFGDKADQESRYVFR